MTVHFAIGKVSLYADSSDNYMDGVKESAVLRVNISDEKPAYP